MLSWFFERWSKSRSFTSNELAVLRLFLPRGDLYAEQLYAQATNAPFVERKLIGMSGYEATIPYVVDDSMLIECDENIESPKIVLTTSAGATMTFSVIILRGGFLRGINGESPKGMLWPKEWNVDIENAQIPSDIRSWIPQPMSKKVREQLLEQLFQWCGIVDQQRDSVTNSETVRLMEPASESLIRSCEVRIQARLGEQYRQLLAITNGFGIHRGRPYEFLGTKDVGFVNGAREWLCVTPLYEEGCIAIQCKDGIASNECFLLKSVGQPNYIGDVKQHVRESLLWDDVSK